MSGILDNIWSSFRINHISEISEGYAIILTSVLIIIGWYVSRLSELKSSRNRQTYEFIALSKNKDFLDRSKVIKDNILRGIPVDKYRSYDSESWSAILLMLSEMEQLAISIRVGFISEKYIMLMEKGMIISIFKVCIPFIIAIRAERKSRAIYENLEMLYVRAQFETNFIILFFEIFFGRRFYELSYLDFRLNFAILSFFLNNKKNYLYLNQDNLKYNYKTMRYVIRLLLVFIVFIFFI